MEHRNTLDESFAAVAKGLANPGRLRLLDLIAQGEQPVEALAETAGLGLSTASAHLQALHRAGLVSRRRDGQRVLYSLAGDDVAALLTTLRSVAQRHVAGVEIARRAALGAEDDLPVVDIGGRDLVRKVRSGELVVIDVRPPHEYDAGHIPGALSVPLDRLARRIEELATDTPVVAYCRGRYCVMSHDAVRLMRRRGLDAAALDGGMVEWRASGAPVRA